MKVQLSNGIQAAVSDVDFTDLCSLETRGGSHHGPARVVGSLKIRVVLLSDGKREVALISTDLIGMGPGWLEEFRGAFERRTGIGRESQVIWCNHIHSAPGYSGVAVEVLAARVAWKVNESRERLVPSEVGFVSKSLGGGWSIRRRFDIDDIDSFCVMFNDDCVVGEKRMEVSGQVISHMKGAGIDPKLWSGYGKKAYCEAPVDTRLELLSFRQRGDKRIIATVARFPVHPVIASHVQIGNTLFPDFIGAFRDTFESVHGGKVLFLVGPCGDIKPLNAEYGIDSANKYGRGLGEAAVKLMRKTKYQVLSDAAIAVNEVKMPYRDEYGWGMKKIKAELDGNVRQTVKEKDQRKLVRLHRQWNVLDRSSRIVPGLVGGGDVPTHATTQVMACCLGDIVIAGFPGEVFSGTGEALLEQLKKARINKRMMVVELTGATIGYLPTPDEYGNGGYEDSMCRFSIKGEPVLRNAMVRAVKQVVGGGRER